MARGRVKGVHTFPKGISPKVNGIAGREFELAYYDSAVHLILKESFSSHQRRQTLIGCYQNLKVIPINRAISVVICLV